MPVISAVGNVGHCLFVLKRKRFPFRSVLKNGKEEIHTVANHLPRLAFVSMREEGGGVDSSNFLWWAKHFVDYIAPLTLGGKKLLLMYYDYRAHMSLDVLSLFKQKNSIVYRLPAHSSGKLQPLDVVAFSVFKTKLNDVVHESMSSVGENGANVYDVCDMMHKAYKDTFVASVIKSSFQRSGVWPISPKKLMSVPRPINGELQGTATIIQMEEMMEERRKEFAGTVFGDRITLPSTGFVDTTKGAILTCEKAIDLIRTKAEAQKNARREERLLREQRSARAAVRLELDRKKAAAMRNSADARRTVMSGMPLDGYRSQLRSLAQRQAVARMRAAQKRVWRDL